MGMTFSQMYKSSTSLISHFWSLSTVISHTEFVNFDIRLCCQFFPLGYYRTEKDKGTQYELFFKKADLMEYRHVTLFRPFGPLMKVKSEMIDITRSIINIIVPLAERTEAFARFMQNFR